MSDISRYEFFEQIAENYLGIYHKARDFKMERWVLAMQLHEKFQKSPDLWKEIWNQILDSIRIKHDCICTVHDVQKEDRIVVLELMNGHLAQKIVAEPLPFDLVRTAIRRSLEGLQVLHENGVIHGNIKPANLLFDQEGYIKNSFSPGLILAGQVPKRETGLKYNAPELLSTEAGSICPATDLYCLGISALELLMGPKYNDLFKGTGEESIDPEFAWMRWHSVLSDKFPSCEDVVPNIPEDLAVVINKMLEKRVADRYQSTAQALNDLDERAKEALVPTDVLPEEPAQYHK